MSENLTNIVTNRGDMDRSPDDEIASLGSWEIQHNLSEDTIKTFAFVSNTIIIPVLCVIGIVINSVGISVIWWDVRRKTMSSFLYLFAVIVFDILFMVGGLIKTAPWIVYLFNRDLSYHIRAQMKLGTMFTDMTFTFSARAVLCVLSFERLLSLIRPPYVMKHILVTKCPLRIISTCFLFTALFLMPIPMNSDIAQKEYNNKTVYILQYKQHISLMKIYMNIIDGLQEVFPVLFLVSLSFLILWKFFYNDKERDGKYSLHSKVMKTKDKAVTLMVMSLVITHSALSVPTVVVKCLQILDEDFHTHGKYGHTICFITDFCSLLMYVNAASDCFAFCVASKCFRNHFARKCRTCCTNKQENVRPLEQTIRLDHIEIHINGERCKLNYSVSYPEGLNRMEFRENSVNPSSGTDIVPNRVLKHHLSI